MKKILIVDDDESIRILVEFYLIQEGYETYLAENGKKAIEIIEKINLDLILTDMMMPVMDGMQLIDILRNTLKVEIPIIMFTAAGSGNQSENTKKALDLGG